MSRHAGWLIGAVLAAVVCVFGFYLYSKAVPYEEVVEHGPSPQAQANPYLAAELFLRQRGSTSSTPTAWKCCPHWSHASTACCCWASAPT